MNRRNFLKFLSVSFVPLPSLNLVQTILRKETRDFIVVDFEGKIVEIKDIIIGRVYIQIWLPEIDGEQFGTIVTLNQKHQNFQVFTVLGINGNELIVTSDMPLNKEITENINGRSYMIDEHSIWNMN